jgi:uncharacterized protein
MAVPNRFAIIAVGCLTLVLGGCRSTSPPPPRSGDERVDALLLAADRGRLSRTMELLDEGQSIESTDPRGRTPLHLAADGGHDTLVRALVRRGAAIDAQDRQGNTALHLAAMRSHRDTVRELLAAGANRTIRNEAGKTAAEVAAPSVRELVQP